MEKIAKFEKVSYNQYAKANKSVSEMDWKIIYDGISLPKRATAGSAGYDFYAPFDITLAPGETVIDGSGPGRGEDFC